VIDRHTGLGGLSTGVCRSYGVLSRSDYAQIFRSDTNNISYMVEKSLLLRSQKYVDHLKRLDIGEDMVNLSFLV